MQTFKNLIWCLLIIGLTVLSHSTGEAQENLILWYSFQGSGNVAKDESGNGNDGTIVGAKRATGKYGKGISIGKEDEYVEIPNVLQPTATIEFWFKPNWDGGDGDTYRLFDATFGDKYFFIGKASEHADFPNNRIGFGFEDAADGDWRDNTMTDASDIISAGNWYHLAVTWEFPGPATFYIDGEEIGSHTAGGFPNLNPNPRIGFNCIDYVAAKYGADGIIDEFAIYAKVLETDEIQRDMEELSLAVEPYEKLSVTWGKIKKSN